MKPGRLYLKIFLSFLLILIVTEILVFGLFILSAGRIFHSRFERHTRTQVLMAKELIEGTIRSKPGVHPVENDSLKDLIRRLGESHGSKIWLASPDGTPLMKSFTGDVPLEVARLSHSRGKDLGDFWIRSDLGRRGGFYVIIPLELSEGNSGSLHVLSERPRRITPTAGSPSAWPQSVWSSDSLSYPFRDASQIPSRG